MIITRSETWAYIDNMGYEKQKRRKEILSIQVFNYLLKKLKSWEKAFTQIIGTKKKFIKIEKLNDILKKYNRLLQTQKKWIREKIFYCAKKNGLNIENK